MPNLGGALGGAMTGAKVGSVAGPWGTAIGAGIGGLVGLFSGGKSKLQKSMEAKIDPMLNNLINWSGESRDKQNAMYNVAMPALRGSAKFYGGLMNNATAVDTMLGPSRTAVNDQYQGMLNAGMYAGRGGGRNMALGNADFARQRAMLEMIPQLQLQAAQGQLNIGQAAGQQALNWGNLATNQTNSVLGVATGSYAQGLQQQQQQEGQGWAGIASQFGELLGPMLGDFSASRARTSANNRLSGMIGAGRNNPIPLNTTAPFKL